MKKILGLSALLAVLVLGACGSSEEIVCVVPADIFGVIGEEVTITAQVEGDVITSVVMESRRDISDLDEAEAAAQAEARNGTIEGNYLVITEESDGEDLEIDLEEFLDDVEAFGGSCD